MPVAPCFLPDEIYRHSKRRSPNARSQHLASAPHRNSHSSASRALLPEDTGSVKRSGMFAISKKIGAPRSAPKLFQPNSFRSAHGRPRRAVARVALEEQCLAGDGGDHRGLERF
jgi:hypothetical protein